VARRRERAVFQDGLGFVSGMALSPDGKVLAVLTQVDVRTEADLQLLEVGTGRPHVVRARPACSFSSVSFTTDGRLLLTGNTAEGMRLWEVTLPKREGK
jgi:dipeptidyl aminopeptidase/acylaminoacyl peptidase